MNKILSIVGARPQFIKLAPLSKVLRTRYHEVVVHTGQHFDEEMSKLIFDDLDMPEPGYNLGIQGGLHGEQAGRMITELEILLLKIRPDLVIVFGDTNSTLAGALVAAKLGIPSVHIEAGLRSYNRSMPEEINRMVADHVCDYLFAPTQTAMNNLEKEGLGSRAFLTGDIMVDSLEMGRGLIRRQTADNLQPATDNRQPVTSNQQPATSNQQPVTSNQQPPYYLLTLHRPYNVDNPHNLTGILSAIAGLELPVVFPVHPRTRIVIEDNQIAVPENILLTKPSGYLEFIRLQENARAVLTDSGGIQKEAYILGTPCITLRPETEWVETVAAGWNLLLDPLAPGFAEKVREFSPGSQRAPVFGENVAARMLEIIDKAILSPNLKP